MKEWEGLYDWASHSKTGLRALATDQGQTDDPEIPLLAKASGVGLNIKKAGARGLQHSPQALDLAEAFLLSLDAWRLSAMQAATMEAKSFIIGMAVITGSGSLPSSYPAVNSQLFSPLDRIPFVDDTAKAVAAARVEEECQIESWGLVEGGHDYDRLNCSIQIHSAAVLSSCITAELLRV
jgi:ATP synthase F1 complex assembly factor 2